MTLMKKISIPLDTHTLNKHILNFFIEYRFLILTLFLTGMLAFGIELANLSINIDEDCALYAPDQILTMLGRSSRWAFYVYSTLLPGINYPFASIFIGILALSLAIPLLLSRYTSSKISMYVFGALVISSPIFCCQIKFIFQCAYVFISLGLCILSFILYDRARLQAPINALAVLLLTFTLLTYQSILFLFFVLFFLELAIQKKPAAQIAKNFLITLTLALCAVLLYFLVNYLLLSVTSMHASSHFSTHIGWGRQPFLKILLSLAAQLKETLSGRNVVYWHIPFLIVPLIVLAFCKCREREREREREYIH